MTFICMQVIKNEKPIFVQKISLCRAYGTQYSKPNDGLFINECICHLASMNQANQFWLNKISIKEQFCDDNLLIKLIEYTCLSLI